MCVLEKWKLGDPKRQLYLKWGESEFQMDERGEVKSSVNVAEFSNCENNCCLLMLLPAEMKVKSLDGLMWLYFCAIPFSPQLCLCLSFVSKCLVISLKILKIKK